MATPRKPPDEITRAALATVHAAAEAFFSVANAFTSSAAWRELEAATSAFAATLRHAVSAEPSAAAAPPASSQTIPAPRVAADAVARLVERFFVPEYLVRGDAVSAVFQPRLPRGGADAAGLRDLAAWLEALAMRLTARLTGAKDVELLLSVGTAGEPCLTAKLGVPSISLDIDLAKAHAALRHMMAMGGQGAAGEGKTASSPRQLALLELNRLSGRLRLAVDSVPPDHLVLTCRVLEPVRIEANTSAGVVAATLMPANPILALEGYASRGDLKLTVATGRLTAELPEAFLRADGRGRLGLDIDALGLTLSMQHGQQQIRMSPLRLGSRASTVTRDGRPYLSIEVRPATSRPFGLVLSRPAAGARSAGVRVHLDDAVTVRLAAGGDAYEAALTPAAAVLDLPARVQAGSPVLSVESGSLRIGSMRGGGAVQVDSGQALMLLPAGTGRAGEPDAMLKRLEVVPA